MEILHYMRARYRGIVMHESRGRWVIVALAAALTSAACHGETNKAGRVPADTAAEMPLPGATTPGSLSARAIPSESTAVATAAPVILHRADSAAGDVIYHGRGRCFTCHGGLGRGTPKLGPSLSDSVWLNGDSSFVAIRGVIAGGVATPRQYSVAMPAYGGMLDDSALTHIAAYVYALSHPGALRSDTLAADSSRRADSTTPRPASHDSIHTPNTP
ncbi:MAG TPA: c-type cytochrome [Gemmatimonadaceae bacterium]